MEELRYAEPKSTIGNLKFAMVYVGRSLMAELRTVTALGEGSTPFGPPKKELSIVDFQFPIGRVVSNINRQLEIGNRKFLELWPRGEVLGCQPRR